MQSIESNSTNRRSDGTFLHRIDSLGFQRPLMPGKGSGASGVLQGNFEVFLKNSHLSYMHDGQFSSPQLHTRRQRTFRSCAVVSVPSYCFETQKPNHALRIGHSVKKSIPMPRSNGT
jgi:hypothetical protein